MSKQTVRLRPDRGLNFDTPPFEASDYFWSRMENVVTRSGFPTRAPGQRNVYEPLQTPPLHLRPYAGANSDTWVYCGASSVFSAIGASHVDITPTHLTGSQSRAYGWTSTMLNGVGVFSNAIDEPFSWDGDTGSPGLILPGWQVGARCEHIHGFKYHLLATGIEVSGTLNENLLIWSGAAEPGTIPQTWTPAADNEAGSAQLSDTPGAIVAAVPLRDSMIIYKRNSAYVLDYVGIAAGVFAIKALWSETGALSSRAVADVDGRHIVVTSGDIVICDGYSPPVSIADKLVRQFLFTQIDQDSFSMLQVVYDHVRQDVWIMFPESGFTYNNRALVYSLGGRTWGTLQLDLVAHASMGIISDVTSSDAWDQNPLTWGQDTTAWTQPSIQKATESLVLAVPGATALVQYAVNDLTVRGALLAKYSMPFGDSERIKFVRQVHIRARSYNILKVRVGSQMFANGPTTWSPEVDLVSPGQPVPTFAQGRFISIEIRSTDAAVWQLTGVDFEVEMRGYF